MEAGLESAPANFIPFLIEGEKLEDAATSLLGAAIVSVKFSFLFFFRALLRQQKKMMVWWWCIFAFLIPTAFIMIFAIFIVCAYWNQEIFGRSTHLSNRARRAIFTDPLKVKCVTPAAHMRQNGVLKSITILDILTDAFRKSRCAILVSTILTNESVISVPVLLLWNVQINIRRKLALGGILCLSVCTMIISIIKVAGGNTSDGGVDSAWVLFWYEFEAAVPIIVVSFTAFRALFVAHQASKYRSPAENTSTSWNVWSRKKESSRREELPELPSPVLGGVRTHIRGSQYGGGGSFDRGGDDMELPLQGPGITVTQEVHSKKVRYLSSSPGGRIEADINSRCTVPALRDLLRNPSYEPQT